MTYRQSRPEYRGPWPTIRKQILARDNHTCQIRGPKCQTTATHVDHIIPTTKGGPWYDPDNLRAACKNCNLGRIDRTQTNNWQTAPTHITLIVGPPGAGKTTHVQQHAQPGDLIIDYDKIADALGGHLTGTTHQNDQLHTATMTARNAILRSLRQGKTNVTRAWIISANPRAETMFPYHRVVVIDPGREETKGRAIKAGRPQKWVDLIDQWYDQRNQPATTQSSSRRW